MGIRFSDCLKDLPLDKANQLKKWRKEFMPLVYGLFVAGMGILIVFTLMNYLNKCNW